MLYQKKLLWKLIIGITRTSIILANVFAIIYLQSQTLSSSNQKSTQMRALDVQLEHQIFLQKISRLPNLGFGNIVSDWLFLDFIQYFGDTLARERLGYGLSPLYFRAIVDRDPKFILAYSFLDPATTLFAGKPSESVEVMNKGVKSLSPKIHNAYLIWIYKAIDELLFLGESENAQKSYEEAFSWAQQQNDPTSLALGQRAKETAEFLSANPDSNQAQIGSWLLVLSNAKDKQTFDLAINKIQKLGGEVIIKGNKMSVKIPQQD